MADQTGHFVGIDVGRVRNPSALCLVGVDFPRGRTEDPPAHYEVMDVRRRRGVPFADIVEECLRIDADLAQDVTFAVDRIGVGAGLHDILLAAGLPCYGVAMTGGARHSVALRGWEMDVPKNYAFEELLGSPLRQGRLRIPRGAGDLLAEELAQVSRVVTEAGTVRYASPAKADGSHGDTVSALAVALTAAFRLGRHWIPLRRQAVHMRRERRNQQPGPRARPRGGPRPRDAARARIQELREDREDRARAEMDLAANPWMAAWKRLDNGED